MDKITLSQTGQSQRDTHCVTPLPSGTWDRRAPGDSKLLVASGSGREGGSDCALGGVFQLRRAGAGDPTTLNVLSAAEALSCALTSAQNRDSACSSYQEAFQRFSKTSLYSLLCVLKPQSIQLMCTPSPK